MFKWLVSIYFWLLLIVWTVLVIFFIAIVRLVLKLLGVKDTQSVCHSLNGFWARTLFRLTPGWRIKVEGLENLPKPGQAVVLVSNHESMADIWALFFLHFNFRWLSKKEVGKVPLVGQAMRWAGYIFIDRGNKNSHAESLNKSAEALKSGASMIFFPEGTRSETGELRPFKIGAFRLAHENNVPILPVAIYGTRNLIVKGSALLSSSMVKIRILPSTTRQNGEDYENYAARVRALIQAEKERISQ